MTIKNNWCTTNLKDMLQDKSLNFTLTINPYSFGVDTFKNNLVRVAREIVSTYDNVYVMYSGGLDSERVIKTFIEENLPFKAVTVSTPFNKKELSFAVKFYKSYGIKPYIIDLTKNQLFDGVEKKHNDHGYSAFIGILPLLVYDHMNSFGSKLVVGHGDPFTVKKDVNLPIHYELYEDEFYLDNYDSSHPGAFYLYDLSLHYSMINNAKNYKDTQLLKSELYELPYRQKIYYDQEMYEGFKELNVNFTRRIVKIPQSDYKSILLGNQSISLP